MTDVFAALSDPTRRSIYERIGFERGSTATDLARDSSVSRQAIAKHLSLLETAGLVERRRLGNRVQFFVTDGGLDEVEQWVKRVRGGWDSRLERLDGP
jgi:DNA-binding transcriptional ArsR family regulator